MIIPLLVGYQIVGSFTLYELLRIKCQSLEKRIVFLEEERSRPQPPAQTIVYKIPYQPLSKTIDADVHRPEYRELL